MSVEADHGPRRVSEATEFRDSWRGRNGYGINKGNQSACWVPRGHWGFLVP